LAAATIEWSSFLYSTKARARHTIRLHGSSRHMTRFDGHQDDPCTLLVCPGLIISVSVLQDIVVSHVNVILRLRWKCNPSCVLSGLRNKSSKLYKISRVLTTRT